MSSSKQFPNEKVRISLERWRDALNTYCSHAEKEYSRLKTLLDSHQSKMSDSDVKNITRLLGKISCFSIKSSSFLSQTCGLGRRKIPKKNC